TQRRDAALDQLRDLIGFAHVGLDGFALASCGTHLFGDFLGRFLLLRRRIVNDDVCTFPREGKRNTGAYSGTAARYKRSLLLHPSHLALRPAGLCLYVSLPTGPATGGRHPLLSAAARVLFCAAFKLPPLLPPLIPLRR